MKHLMSFLENKKMDFDDLFFEDIELAFIDMQDAGQAELKPSNIKDLTEDGYKPYGEYYMLFPETENQKYNSINISRNPEKSIIFDLFIKHPKFSIRSTSLDIYGYSRDTAKHALNRFYKNYNIEIYYNILHTNFMGENIGEIRIVIVPKK